jgi:hypothetical protein
MSGRATTQIAVAGWAARYVLVLIGNVKCRTEWLSLGDRSYTRGARSRSSWLKFLQTLPIG